jgi:hypothetical protein
MNRFDADFNDVDPITSRPFSWGHPDGVWIIGIIYTLISLTSFVAVIAGVFKLFSPGWLGLALLVGGGVGLFLFLSAVILLFKRSQQSFYPAIAILALSAGIFAIVSFVDFKSSLAALAALGVQSYICYYIYGLKKDESLGNGVK